MGNAHNKISRWPKKVQNIATKSFATSISNCSARQIKNLFTVYGIKNINDLENIYKRLRSYSFGK